MSRLKQDKLAKGLANHPGENNCFLNCAVQVLWHLPSFSQSLHQLSGHRCSGSMACIFCAMKVTFAQLLYSDQTTLLPDTMRKALAMAFSEEQRFQVGNMGDASECLETLLHQIHLHLCDSTTDICQEPHCISHEKFSMNLTEEVVCKCMARNDPLTFQQIVQYISAEALVSEIRHILITATYQPQIFDKILSRAIHAGDLRDCPNRCGWKAQIKRTLISCPDFITFGLAWDNNKIDVGKLRDVWESVGSTVRLSELFDNPEEDSSPLQTPHYLWGIICFYGKHYSTFCLCDNNWIHYDDHIVNKIGPDWSDVVSKCIRGRFRPVILLYSRSHPKPFNSSTALKETQLVSMEDFKHSAENLKKAPLIRSIRSNDEGGFLHGGSHIYHNSDADWGSLPCRKSHHCSMEILLGPGSDQSTLNNTRVSAKSPCPPLLSQLSLAGDCSNNVPPVQDSSRGRPPLPNRRQLFADNVHLSSRQEHRSRFSNVEVNSSSARRGSESSLSLSIRAPSPSPSLRQLVQPLQQQQQPSVPALGRSVQQDMPGSYISRATVAQIMQLQKQHRSSSATRTGVRMQLSLPMTASAVRNSPVDRLAMDDRNSKVSSVTSDSGISGDGSSLPSVDQHSPTNQLNSSQQAPSRITPSHQIGTDLEIHPATSLSSPNDVNSISTDSRIPSPDQIQDLFNSLPRRNSSTTSSNAVSIYATTGRRSSQPVVHSFTPTPSISTSSPTVVSLSTSSSSSSLVAASESENSGLRSRAPPLKLLSTDHKQICPNCRSIDGWQSEIRKCFKCKATFTKEELEKQEELLRAKNSPVQPTRSCLMKNPKHSSKGISKISKLRLINSHHSSSHSDNPRVKKSVTFHDDLCTVVDLTPESPHVSPEIVDDSDQFNTHAFRQRVLVELESDRLNNNVSTHQEHVLPSLPMCNLCQQAKVIDSQTYCSSCSVYMQQFS